MKKIVIKSCMECPLVGKCPAWKGLSAKDRFAIKVSTSVPSDFILTKCHLENN